MRVVDGNTDYLLKKDDFIKLYNDKNIPVKEIQKRLKLTLTQYRKIRKECIDEGLLKLRHPPYHTKKENPPKYYYPANRSIHRESYDIHRKGVYYCICKTVAEAELTVKKLKECEWDKSQIERIKKEVKEELQ